jgi:hypothetical protein
MLTEWQGRPRQDLGIFSIIVIIVIVVAMPLFKGMIGLLGCFLPPRECFTSNTPDIRMDFSVSKAYENAS